MKVSSLRNLLEGYLEDLECYNGNDEVKLSANTYGMSNNFIATYNGYIDMNDPVKDSEEDFYYEN